MSKGFNSTPSKSAKTLELIIPAQHMTNVCLRIHMHCESTFVILTVFICQVELTHLGTRNKLTQIDFFLFDAFHTLGPSWAI